MTDKWFFIYTTLSNSLPAILPAYYGIERIGLFIILIVFPIVSLSILNTVLIRTP